MAKSSSLIIFLIVGVVAVAVLYMLYSGKSLPAGGNQPPGGMPTITVGSSYTEGQSIQWSASGFAPNSSLSVVVYNTQTNTSITLSGSRVQTDSSGNASSSFAAGANIVGSDQLTVKDASGNSASADFTVSS